MNRHESDFRKTLNSVLICLGLWIAIMVLGKALPSSVEISPLLFFLVEALIFGLLAAIVVLGVAAGIAYIRWKIPKSSPIEDRKPIAPVVPPPTESEARD